MNRESLFSRIFVCAVAFFVATVVSSEDLSYKLLDAANSGKTDAVIQLLSRGADVESKTSTGATALAVAANGGFTETVKALIENGASLGSRAQGAPMKSARLSSGKRKGSGNVRNGNPYLSWAFSEAAHFAIRYHPEAKKYFQRKRSKTNGIIAIRALAHKLARAFYYVMKD